MSVRTDVVNLIVNVNGNQSQAQLNELRKKAADIKLQMQGLVKGTKDYVAAAAELKKVNSDMDALKKTIGITSLSQKELVAELNKLKALKGSVAPFTKEFKELDAQIKLVDKRLYDVRNGVQGFASMYSRLGDQVKQFGVLAAGYLGFQFISGQFRNIINGASKLSDQLGDLQRVAGLTASEAETLNRQLGQINTRTTTAGLREIAVIAGKLGVAKKDVFEFTKAIDQLVVSLGDELGDADQITTQLGKILSVFDGDINGDNITRLGNAFVELANTGSSTGGFIADFDQRLSATAKSANIGLGELSGLGAGLEELGSRVESSSTAIQKLIITIGQDLPKAARIAGISEKEFKKLYDENATEALLRYSEGLVKNKKSFSDFTASLKDSGEEGARTIETIGKLGNSADYLRGRIELGKKSLQESSAITEAFAIKNETFGATIDKIGKAFNRLVSNSTFLNYLKDVAKGFLDLITPAKSAAEQYEILSREVSRLDKEIVPLLNRYDELKAKAQLNTAEQAELNKIIQTVSATIPGAVTQFDNYGNAIAISTTRVREFINAEKARLGVVNAKAIDEYNKKLKETNRLLGGLKSDLDEIAKTGSFTTVTVGGGTGGGAASVRRANTNEVAAAQEKYKNLVQQKLGYETEIKRLNGDAIEEQNKAAEEAAKKAAEAKKKADEEAKKNIATPSATGGSTAAASNKNSEFAQLKKDAAAYLKELNDLKKKAQIQGLEPEQEEIAAVQKKYDELLARLKDYYIKQAVDKKQYTAAEKTLEEAHRQELQNIFDKYQKKRFDEGTAAEYEESLELRREFSIKLKDQVAQEYAEGKIGKQQYERELKTIDRNETADRIIIAKDYSTNVKKAAADVTKFKKEQEKQQTEDLRQDAEERTEISRSEALARAQRKVLTARPGSDARLEANKERLKLEFEQETEFLDKKTELYKLKETELQESIKELEQNAQLEKIARVLEYVGFFQDALNSFNTFLNNRENRLLQKEKNANDVKRKNYRAQLDDKLISQQVYDKKIAVLQEEEDKRNREIKRRQAKREKALNLFGAIVSTSAAVIKALVDPGGLPGVALSIAAGITGALQIAAIANTPLPEAARGGFFTKGNKHSQGGIPIEIERNEAVISAPAMESNKRYTVSGTSAQITSALNSKAGGVNWAGGAIIREMKFGQPGSRINSSLPGSIEANSGIVRSSPAANNERMEALMGELIGETQRNTSEISTMKKDLNASISLQQFRKQSRLYDQAQKASGF